MVDPGTHRCYPEVWPCAPCPPCRHSLPSCHTPAPRRSPGLLSAAPHPGSLPLLLTGQWLLALQDWPAAVSSPRSTRLSRGQSLNSARIDRAPFCPQQCLAQFCTFPSFLVLFSLPPHFAFLRHLPRKLPGPSLCLRLCFQGGSKYGKDFWKKK